MKPKAQKYCDAVHHFSMLEAERKSNPKSPFQKKKLPVPIRKNPS